LIATAEALARLDPALDLVAVGTAEGLETEVVPAAGLRLELIPAVPLPRRPGLDLLRTPSRLRGAVHAASAILRTHQAEVVCGFGGYVSSPVYLAARRLRLPIVIHEGNALPGLANRLAARLTRHVATSFPATRLPHARCVGLPLRAAIDGFDRDALRPDGLAAFDLESERPTLVVSGGSLGARRINDALESARSGLLAAGVQILHVVGPRNLADTTDGGAPRWVATDDPATGARYRPVGFVDRMELAYAVADLMVCRAGANTVAETAAIGVPCVYVPLPVGNGEQARNAEPVLAAGGCRLVPDGDLTAARLTAEVSELLGDRAALQTMSRAAQDVMPRTGATELARWILQVAKESHGTA